jgi:single-strand DNA-binding protein
MNEIPAYLTGNLTHDVELSHSSDGRPRANVRVAVTPRRYNPESAKHEDGVTTFVDATVWGAQAERVAHSLRVGDRVIVQGRWVTRLFTTQAGEEVRRVQVVVDEIGPALRWATATVTRMGREDAPSGQASWPAGSFQRKNND